MKKVFPRGGVMPGQYLRSKGLQSMQHLSDETTIPLSTLRDWYRYKPTFFDIVISGVLAVLNDRSGADNASR